jgi:hypothetical protein
MMMLDHFMCGMGDARRGEVVFGVACRRVSILTAPTWLVWIVQVRLFS